MIKINKLYTKNHQHFLMLENEDNLKVSIPIDSIHFNRITIYLNKFSKGLHPYSIEEELEDE